MNSLSPVSGIKTYFKNACNMAMIKDPADWEWSDCMLDAKRKYPKHGVHKSVFLKWKDQYLIERWDAWDKFRNDYPSPIGI